MTKSTIDISDFDPFAASPPSSTSSSRLFPTSSTSSSPLPPPTTAPTRAPQKADVHAQPVQGGADPLGNLLGGLSLSAPSPSPSPTSFAGGSTAQRIPAAASVQAQEQRSASILADLNREPFTAEPSSSSFSSASAVPIPSTSTSGSHTHPSRAFSPPRRLSTLMSSVSPFASSSLSSHPNSSAVGSPPASSSILSDPFHPAHLTQEGDVRRRMREASGDWGGLEEALNGKIGGAAGGGDGDASWGDFQEAPPTPPKAKPKRPTPSPSRQSAPAPSSTAPRSSTYPDPSTLSVRSKPSRTATTGNGGIGGGGGGGSAFDPSAQPIRLVGVRPGVQRVLDEDVAEGLRPSLPPRLRLSPRWTLLYSLDQHGISLSTFFSQLDKGLNRDSGRDGGFVLVVRTEKGEVLGAYVSEALKRPGREERGERWVGDGSCFLFLTRPFPPSDPRLGLAVKTFPPTFRNTYFAHASPPSSTSSSSSDAEGFLAFGGGNDGVFGLWIDGKLERGWTGRSETYANEALVKREGEDKDGKGKFEVVGLECWAVGT